MSSPEYNQAYYKANRARIRAKAAAWYQANKEQAHAAAKRSAAKYPERVKERQRKYRKAHPEGYRRANRDYARRKTGVVLPAHPCPAACECCGRLSENLPRKALVPDHSHLTRQARGWLCNQCNSGIGMLGDTLEAVEKAVAYLKRARIASGDLP